MSLRRLLVVVLALATACAGCASISGAARDGSTLFGRVPAVSPGGDEPSINPDRPDHTNSAYTVPPSLVQLESGGQWVRVRPQGEIVLTPVTVRAGIGSWFEGRIDTTGLVWVSQPDGASTQFGGAVLGGKFRVWPAPGGFVLAVMPQITLPLGRGADNGADVSLTFLTGRDINERFHVDGNYQVVSVSAGRSRFTAQMLSVSASMSATSNWQPYGELYWLSRTEPGGGHFRGFDAGAIYTLNQRAALDVAVDTSLSNATLRPALMAGLSLILGEVSGHQGVAARMREAQRRGDR
jgi:hypothetical protein